MNRNIISEAKKVTQEDKAEAKTYDTTAEDDFFVVVKGLADVVDYEETDDADDECGDGGYFRHTEVKNATKDNNKGDH